MSYSYTTITTTVDMNENNLEYYEYILLDATAGNIDVKLPSAYDGSYYQFDRKDTTSNTVNITCQTGDTINGGSSIVMPINRYCQCVKIGTDWRFKRISVN